MALEIECWSKKGVISIENKKVTDPSDGSVTKEMSFIKVLWFFPRQRGIEHQRTFTLESFSYLYVELFYG